MTTYTYSSDGSDPQVSSYTETTAADGTITNSTTGDVPVFDMGSLMTMESNNEQLFYSDPTGEYAAQSNVTSS